LTEVKAGEGYHHPPKEKATSQYPELAGECLDLLGGLYSSLLVLVICHCGQFR
jgi:hypothetical protein